MTGPDGESGTYRRVPFELLGDDPLRRLTDPPTISWAASGGHHRKLMSLMTHVLEASVDPRDRSAVQAFGAQAVAEAMLSDAQSGSTYEGHHDWWSIVEVEGVASGFVLPAIFSGCAREGLDEGTIYHLGVIPERRGQHLGALLLARATDALLEHGVWRIDADTAAENGPMIRLFEAQGWTRKRQATVAAHPLPGLTAPS